METGIELRTGAKQLFYLKVSNSDICCHLEQNSSPVHRGRAGAVISLHRTLLLLNTDKNGEWSVNILLVWWDITKQHDEAFKLNMYKYMCVMIRSLFFGFSILIFTDKTNTNDK